MEINEYFKVFSKQFSDFLKLSLDMQKNISQSAMHYDSERMRDNRLVESEFNIFSETTKVNPKDYHFEHLKNGRLKFVNNQTNEVVFEFIPACELLSEHGIIVAPWRESYQI